MKLISRVFIFCTWNTMLVTGEQLFLLNTRNDIYRYDTVTKEAKKLANRARYMACDMERNFLYYTIQPIRNDQNFTKIIRIDEDGKNMKTISDEVNILPVSTILMITGAVVSGIVLIVVPAVAIRKFYKAKQDSMPRSLDNGPTEYSSCNGNTPKECHVYTTMHSTGYLELNTMPPPLYEDIL